MNEINFLSDSFLQGQDRRGRAYREAALILVVIVAMCGWGLTSWQHITDLEQRVRMRQAEAGSLDVQTEQLAQLEQQHQALEARVTLQQELALPVDVSAVVATIGQLMPESLTLKHLALTAPRPQPAQNVDPATGAGKTSRPSAGGKAATMRIELRGVCPSDGQISRFYGDLTDHPLFDSVELIYSSPMRIMDVAGRKFQIEMVVPLDRWYAPAATSANKEVAHAG